MTGPRHLPVPTGPDFRVIQREPRPPREVTGDRASIMAWRRFSLPPRGWIVETAHVKQLGEDFDNRCGWCDRAIGPNANWIFHPSHDRKMFVCEECVLTLVEPPEGSTFTEADRAIALEAARYTTANRCRRVNKRLAMHEQSNWKPLGGPVYRYFPPEWDDNETLVVFWHDIDALWFWKAVLPDGTIDEKGPYDSLMAATERFIGCLIYEENAAGQA